MPPSFPLHEEAVYISGFFEIIGGAPSLLAMPLAHPMEAVHSTELEAFIDRKAQQRLEFRMLGRPLNIGLGLRIIDRPVLALRLGIDGVRLI